MVIIIADNAADSTMPRGTVTWTEADQTHTVAGRGRRAPRTTRTSRPTGRSRSVRADRPAAAWSRPQADDPAALRAARQPSKRRVPLYVK